MTYNPFVVRSPAIKINGVDLSGWIGEVAVDMTADDVDVTASGAGGKQRILGIRDDSFKLTVFSDFQANAVDATIWPLFNGGSLFLVEVWANPSGVMSTVASTVNPKYSGTCILTNYSPIAGAIGDAAKTDVTLPVQGVITRSTT